MNQASRILIVLSLAVIMSLSPSSATFILVDPTPFSDITGISDLSAPPVQAGATVFFDDMEGGAPG